MDLRPEKLEDFIGNDNTRQSLSIQISAAHKRKSPLPHTLFKGWFGCGKTTLSYLTSKAMNSKYHFLNAATISKKSQLIQVLSILEENDVLLIDEIHRLDITLEELLYPVMEDYYLSIPTKSGIRELRIKPFTLMGATTDPGLLSGAFLSRFKSQYHLEPYSDENICEILKVNARKMGMNITEKALLEIAKRSKRVPRIANARLEWLDDWRLHFNLTQIDYTDVVKAMLTRGIDDSGLEQDDRVYLAALSTEKGTGLGTLSSMTGLTEETIMRTIEPFLVNKKIIRIERAGRFLLENAASYSQRADNERIDYSLGTEDLETIL